MGEKGSVTGMGRHDDRPLRGALIGFGNAAARAHLPAWEGNDDFRIVAVAEPDAERARLAAQPFPMRICIAKQALSFVAMISISSISVPLRASMKSW